MGGGPESRCIGRVYGAGGDRAEVLSAPFTHYPFGAGIIFLILAHPVYKT